MVRRIDFAAVSRLGAMDYKTFSKLQTGKTGLAGRSFQSPKVIRSVDSVRFSGAQTVQSPPPKNWLKTLLTMTLLGSSLPFAQAAKQQWVSSGEGDTLREWQPMGNTASTPPMPGLGAGKTALAHPSMTTPMDWETAVPVNQYGFPQGAVLADPREAIALAKKGEIAAEPDALKLITGPANQELFYEIRLKNGSHVGLAIPEDQFEHQAFLKMLKGDFNIEAKPAPMEQSSLLGKTAMAALQLTPIVTMLAMISVLMRNLKGSMGGAGEVAHFNKVKPSKTEAKKKEAEKPVTFEDVRGYPEVIRELRRVRDRYLQGNLNRGDSKIPVKPLKGLLLEGPPGTGKSMMAKALATESKVPFHYVSGSQFVEMFVGVGAARVRSLFEQARRDADKHGGAIIFIDELDSIGGKRGQNSYNGGNEERVNALNELLQQMSGFRDDPRIMVLAATNRADYLDDALKRSGRFDKIIQVDLPHDKEQRRDILDKYLSEYPTAKKLDRDAMAEFSQGKSGADLANLVNQMAEAAVDRVSDARHDADKKQLLKDPEFHKLNTIDFMNALRNMEMGMRREANGTDDERKTVAIHEVLGHGLVAKAAKTPLHIVSMQPRGNALGHVITDPRGSSRKLPTLESLLKDLVISMGGRASEREMLGAERITPGASGDIEQSKAKIRQMLATRMLDQASGADYNDPYSALNDQDRKLADFMLKQAETTAEEVLRTVPKEKLWDLVHKALSLKDELEGEAANAFYQDVIDTVGEEKLYRPIQQFIRNMVTPAKSE